MSSNKETMDKLRDEEANIQYRAEDLDDLKGKLGDMIQHHINYQRPRLKILDNYFKSYNEGIKNRKAPYNKSKADNRTSSAYASYISEFIQGYLLGIPVKTTTRDEGMELLVSGVRERHDIDYLNGELLLDLSKYGRAYELVYHRKKLGDKTILLPVNNTFMVYDNTITGEEIGAVYYRLADDYSVKKDRLNNDRSIFVTLYTSEEAITLKPTKELNFEYVEKEDGVQKHGASEVPVIVYEQDRTRQGDYERVITAIDAYDNQLSDLANYNDDLQKSILTLSGDLTGLDWEQISENLSDGLFLGLDSGQDVDGNPRPIKAEYLNKSYDVTGTESSLRTIREDIHKFTKVPDLTDTNFSGNESGISMRYRLFGLEQLAGKKTRAMEKGFNKRYRLLVDLNETVRDISNIEDPSVHYTWTYNIPENVIDELKSFIDAGGKLSQETLLNTLSFVDSVEDEKKRIVAEELGVTFEEVNGLTTDEIKQRLAGIYKEESVKVSETELEENKRLNLTETAE